MYYGTAVEPQKVDIVVIRNDNKANVKTIKADVTSFPASVVSNRNRAYNFI